MALKTHLVDVNFDQGIDTRDDGFLITGSFEEMINIERQKAGGIIKRNGFDQITQNGITGNVLKIAEISGTLCCITDIAAYKFNGTSWEFIDYIPSRTIVGASRPFKKDEIPFYVYNDGTNNYLITKKVNTYIFSKLNSDFSGIESYNLASFTTLGKVYFLKTANNRLVICYDYFFGSASLLQYFGSTLEGTCSIDVGGGGRLISACVHNNTVFVSGTTQNLPPVFLRVQKFTIVPLVAPVEDSNLFVNMTTTNPDSFESSCGSCTDGSRFFLAVAQKTGGGSITPSSIAGGTRITLSANIAYSVYVGDVFVYSNTSNIIDVTSGATTPTNLITYINGIAVQTTEAYAFGVYLRQDIKIVCSIGTVLLYCDRITAYGVVSANPATFISSSVDTSGVYKILRSNFNLSSPTWFSSSISFSNFYKNDLAISNSTTGYFDLFVSNNLTNECKKYSFNKNDNLEYGSSVIFSNCVVCGERLGDEAVFIDKSSFTSFIKNLVTSKIMLVFGQGTSSIDDDSGNYSPSFYSDSAIVNRLSIDGPDVFNVIRQEKINNSNIQTLQLFDKLAIACGILCYVTPFEVCEFGFFQSPVIVVETNSAGGSLSAGQYGYAFTFSYVNTNGEKEESTPTFLTKTVLANTKEYFKLSLPNETLRQLNICYVNIYRTNVNESIFNLIFSSKVTSQYFEYTDNGQATNFQSEVISIYTTGGILPNTAIGACFSLCSTKNRLFVASSEDKTKLFYSKEKLTGYAFEFSGLQYIDCNGGQFEGEITSIAGLDEKIIIGKDKYLLAIHGDGPNAAGGGSDFSIPQSISTDVGISDKNSVVIVPEGLMFKTKKGIYLLNRGLQIGYIGVLADKYSQSTVYSSIMASSKNLVFFGLSNLILVYDYLLKNWFQWKGNTGIIDSISSCLIGDTLHVLTSGGRILKQNSNYTDQLNLVPSYENIITEIETSWLEAGMINGFQRLRRVMVLGHGWGAASYDIKISRDYVSTPLETHVMAITEVSGAKVQRNLHVANQKSATVKINFKETGSGTAFKTALSGMTFEIGAKKGTAKVSSSNKF